MPLWLFLLHAAGACSCPWISPTCPLGPGCLPEPIAAQYASPMGHASDSSLIKPRFGSASLRQTLVWITFYLLSGIIHRNFRHVKLQPCSSCHTEPTLMLWPNRRLKILAFLVYISICKLGGRKLVWKKPWGFLGIIFNNSINSSQSTFSLFLTDALDFDFPLPEMEVKHSTIKSEGEKLQGVHIFPNEILLAMWTASCPD